MTTTCPQCGNRVTPGQPVCTECGRSLAPPAGGESPNGAAGSGDVPKSSEAAPQRPAKIRRDKAKDFAVVGTVVAEKYKVLEVLGQGGFGTVYLVEIVAGMVGEKLALKILPEELSAEPAFRTQFLNEIRVAMRLVDRSIVQIRDVGTTADGLLYYTMDYCPGITLAQILRREGRLPVSRSIVLVLNVLRALQTAHAAGIIHRDLKPANVMVEGPVGKETVRVLDFGIATAITTGPEEEQPKEKRGFAGSPAYMPPEQFLGSEIGFYTDLYAVGVILYECLTGRKPHSGSTPQEVFRSLKTKQVAPPESITPEVSGYPGLSEAVLKCLEKNPERRTQSARELFDQLNEILVRGTTVSSESAPPRRAAAPGPRATTPRQVPAGRQPPPARPSGPSPTAVRAAERIRRSRGSALNRPPRLRVWSVALATLIVGSVVAGLLFHKELEGVWSRITGSGSEGTSGGEGGSPTKKETTSEPTTVKDTGATDIEKTRAEAKERYLKRLLDEASQALAKQDPSAALEATVKALGLDPENAAALRLRGLAAELLGKYDLAIESLERARALLGEDGVDKDALRTLVRAKANLPAPHVDEAETMAMELATEHPDDPDYVALVAYVLERKGDKERIQKLLVAARDRGLRSAELDELYDRHVLAAQRATQQQAAALLAQAGEAFKGGQFRKALGLAEESALLVASAEADYLQAECLIELQRAQDGTRLVEDALARRSAAETGPAAVDVRERLIAYREFFQAMIASEAALRAEGDARAKGLADAEATLLRALERLTKAPESSATPLTPRVRLEIGTIRAARGDVTGMGEILGPLESSGSPAHLGRVAEVYLAAAKTAPSDALKEEAYTRARKAAMVVSSTGVTSTDRAVARMRAGLCDLGMGDLTGKESYYRAALDHFAATESAGQISTELYESWSRAYDGVGNLIRAALSLRRAYELEPTPDRCLRAIDAYLEANPQSREAKELRQEARIRFPDDPRFREES